ncbi:MAG: large conductance mechanosensitive channel protein MscL [Chloroflexota bacterium]
MGKVWKEFREFAMRGSLIDMAVGIIIGGAFGAVIKSLVADLLMPPLGLLLGNADFTNLFSVMRDGEVAGPYATLLEAQEAGAVTINYGLFIVAIINFILIAFAVFMLVRTINRLRAEEEEVVEEPTTKECPYCMSTIALNATRCAFCTADLTGN